MSTDLRALNQNVLKRRADWLSKLEGGYIILCYLPPIRLIILLSNVREAAALTSDSATSSKGL